MARFPYFYNVLLKKWPDFNFFSISFTKLARFSRKRWWAKGSKVRVLRIIISTLVGVDNTYRCRVSGSSESSSIHETSHAHANLLHFRFWWEGHLSHRTLGRKPTVGCHQRQHYPLPILLQVIWKILRPFLSRVRKTLGEKLSKFKEISICNRNISRIGGNMHMNQRRLQGFLLAKMHTQLMELANACDSKKSKRKQKWRNCKRQTVEELSFCFVLLWYMKTIVGIVWCTEKIRLDIKKCCHKLHFLN